MCFAAMFGLKFYRAYQIGRNMQQPTESVQFESPLQAADGDEAVNGAYAQAGQSDGTNSSWFAQAAETVMDKVKSQFGGEAESSAGSLDLQKQLDALEIASNHNAGQPRAPS